MDSILLIGVVAATVVLVCSTKNAVSGMDDEEISIENVRRGIKNGWYSADLVIVDGRTAIRLTGKNTDGEIFSDVYPVSRANYDQLKAEGIPEA